ncbi:MAG: efflux RND transporter periplasmic adaptor subunit, partial [Planctomycetota bacterium]|nr:efflux RND transporter periplasmic adaptor subunit [Planctomycetota bacterium]
IFPRSTGVITSILVEEGDRVEAGEVLAVIDPRDAQASLADAQIALKEAHEATSRLALTRDEADQRVARSRLAWEQAQREVQRNEEAGLLSEVDLDKLRLARDTSEHDHLATKLSAQISQQELERQKTVIERAELTVQRQELALSHTQIVAPFTGILASRAIKVGDSAGGTAAAFTLTDPDNLRAIVYRPQRELSFFQNSSDLSTVEIRVQPEALPGQVFKGTINFLSPTIDATSGSFRITLSLDQSTTESAGPRLAPGMLARIDIVTERRPNALVVPKRALRREGDSQFLFVVRESKAVRLRVEEGLSDDEYVELVLADEGSIETGEAVIVVGNRDLEGGEDVRVNTLDDGQENTDV